MRWLPPHARHAPPRPRCAGAASQRERHALSGAPLHQSAYHRIERHNALARTGFARGELEVDLLPSWPEERFPLYALYPSRLHPSAKTRAFLDLIASLSA
jgi:DNA-binding transcriptional LysR family regulator